MGTLANKKVILEPTSLVLSKVLLTLNNCSRENLNEANTFTCSMKVNLRDLNLRVNLMRCELELEFRDFCK